MRKQDIEIVISPTGEVTFQVKGVKGGSCIDETKFREFAEGAKTGCPVSQALAGTDIRLETTLKS